MRVGKKVMGLNKKYRKSLEKQWAMRFKTRHPDGDSYDGVVTHIKPKFIALSELRDFEFDGAEVFPKKFIKGYRDGKYEKCANELIREIGEIDKIQPLQWLDECETIRDVIAKLHEKDIWPGIEMIHKKVAGSSFYLGPITAVKRRHFRLWCYDATGQWESEYILQYREICRIVIDNRYCRNFNAYMHEMWERIEPEKQSATESIA